MKHDSFEDFLKEKCEAAGGFTAVLDDDYPEAFEKWLETKEGDWLIQYAEEYGQKMVEYGRLTALQDFDAVCMADAFIGVSNEELAAVKKFFTFNKQLSG